MEVYAQKKRTPTEGVEVYTEFVRELKARCQNKEKQVISFHHDMTLTRHTKEDTTSM